MSGTLWLGLVLQASAVAALFAVYRRGAWRMIGTYFVLSAFVYHGVTELVQRATGYSTYRDFASTRSIDQWTVTVGCAMLLFTAAYIAVSSFKAPSAGGVDPSDVRRVFAVLDWRVLAVLCVPLIAVVGTSSYRIGDQSQLAPVAPSAAAGLAGQFLTLTLALATIGFVVRHGRFLLPLLVQLGVTALIGSRLEIVLAAATTLFGLAILRRSPSWRQLAGAAAVVAVLAVSISAARSHVGRDQFTAASITGRVQLLAGGAVDAIEGKPAVVQGQQNPLGERLDGNSFPAAVATALSSDHRTPVHLATARNDAILAVPSFLNPAKLSTDLESRSEKAYYLDHFGILLQRDFIPTQFGTLLGWYGPVGLLFLAAALGAVVGAAERAVRRRLTPTRLIFTLALFACVMDYPDGMDVWLLELRGAAALGVAVWLVTRWVQRRRPSRVVRGAVTSGGRSR